MTNELTKLQYTLEIEDHLYEIYNDFQRRNNLEEWKYFLQRLELAEKKCYEEISKQLLSYHLDCGNIKQEIVQFIETFFHYMDHVNFYAEAFSYSALEYYSQVMLTKKEFPPIDELGDLSLDVNYDEFIDQFQALYFGEPPETAELYTQQLKALMSYGIDHPYLALLESECYALYQDAENALSVLKKMKPCYHKHLALGMLLIDLEYYEEAEDSLRYARELHTGKIDNAFVEGMFIALFYQGKHLEALTFADEMEGLGFGHVLASYKTEVLSSFYAYAGEKAKQRPLEPAEISLIFDYLWLEKEYDKIIALGEQKQEEGTLTERDWLILIETYLMTCNYQLAEENIQKAYQMEPAPSAKAQVQMKVLKAQLRFLEGRTADAYALMDDLYLHDRLNTKQLEIYAQMCFTTGRDHTAEKIYSALRFDAPENPDYLTALTRIFLKNDEADRAYAFSKQGLEKFPNHEEVVYYAVQSAIDNREVLKAKQILRKVKNILPAEKYGFLNAQIDEALYSTEDAKETFKTLIKKINLDEADAKTAEDIYLHYFLLMIEEEVMTDVLFDAMDAAMRKLKSRSKIYELYGDVQSTTMEDTLAAKKYYKMALEENPYNNSALLSMMTLCTETHRDEEAWQYASQYVINTDSAQAYMIRAHIALDAGRFDDFEKDVEQYVHCGGNKYEAYDLAATYAMKTGDYEKALSCFEQMLQQEPADETPCYGDMAVCLCKMGRYQDAVELLQQVLIQDDYAEFYPLLLEIQEYIGDFDGAKKTLEKYRKVAGLSKTDNDYLFYLVQLQIASGKFKTAILSSQAGKSKDNEVAQLFGQACLLNGNYKLALGLFYMLIEEEPFNLDDYAWMALAARLQGDEDQSWNYAVRGRTRFKSVHGEPNEIARPDLLCQYGFLQTLCGKTEKALTAFEKALNQPTCAEEICQHCHEAHYGMAVLYALNGEKTLAKEYFDKALDASPYNPVYQAMKKALGK